MPMAWAVADDESKDMEMDRGMPKGEAVETSVAGAWWNGPYSNVQTNIQEIDATMDVERVLDFIEGHGADTWLLNVGGIASFYPSALPFQPHIGFLKDRPS